MSSLFGAHSLWRDTLHSLDTGSRALVLPKCANFVDSPLEDLPSLRYGLGWAEENVGGVGREEGGGTRFGM